jgi:hypothetical protein
LHVGLASGQILRVPGVDQVHLQTAGIEDLVERDPIDAGGLHGDGGDATLLKPVREAMEISRKTVKPADRIRIAIGPDSDVVRVVADVDARRVRMHDVESGVGGLQTAREVFALLAGEP